MATRTIVRLADQNSGFLTNQSASTTYQAKVANVSDTEIGYLDGATSGIQSQIDSKLSVSSASSTYLTQVSASTNYAPIITPVQTGFRNKIINGDFQFWQRSADTNVDISTNGTFFADRWSKSGSSGTASALVGTSAVSDLPLTQAGIARYVRWSQTVAPTVSQSIGTKIEGVRTLNNRTVTLSFYARLASGTFPFSISYSQYGGDVGSSGFFGPYQVTDPIKDMSGNTVTSPTASWARYYVTFNILPLAGRMSVATTGDDYLQIQFSSPSSGTWQFDLTGVQLEEGSFPTPFEQLPHGLKLQLCQRYYQRISPNNTISLGFGHVQSGNTERFTIPTPVSLRSFPSALTATGTYTSVGNGGGGTLSSIGVVEVEPNFIVLSATSSLAHTVGALVIFGVSGNVLAFSAEI